MQTISQIYAQYKIPPNLQRHMYEVASVGAFIVDHWRGEEKLNGDEIITELLLHDVGNIIKFDLDNYAHLLGEEEQGRIDYWKEVQKNFKEKWGDEEHEATEKVLRDIGVSEEIIYIINNSGSSKASELINSDDWRLKICTYADGRVGPDGVMSVRGRFQEIIDRYKGREHSLANVEDVEKRRDSILVLERQIDEKLNIPLSTVTNQVIKPYLLKLRSFRI